MYNVTPSDGGDRVATTNLVAVAIAFWNATQFVVVVSSVFIARKKVSVISTMPYARRLPITLRELSQSVRKKSYKYLPRTGRLVTCVKKTR